MIHIDDSDLRAAMQHLARAMSAEGVSKSIKRQASAKLRKVMKPMVNKRRLAVLNLPTGKGHQGAGMRIAVAKKVVAATRWKGKQGGVSVIQRARGMPRNFNMAGRMFNRTEGWFPQDRSGATFHQQVTPVEWFDSQADVQEARMVRHEIVQALDEVAGTIANEIRRIR
jgi:hypothetical protein